MNAEALNDEGVLELMRQGSHDRVYGKVISNKSFSMNFLNTF